MDTDELPVVAPADEPSRSGTVARAEDARAPDRRTVRDARRRTRRVRRLYVLSGLVVLATFLAATIVVVDMVR